MHSALQPHCTLIAFASVVFLIGSLIVVWAALFSFFEVRRIAADRSPSSCLGDSDHGIDPDAPRVVIVEPPTGEAIPHHEDHLGSRGLDQGQLTSRIPDTFPTAVTPTGARGRNKAKANERTRA